MRPNPAFASLYILAALAAGPAAAAEGFKFSEQDEADRAEREGTQSPIAHDSATARHAEARQSRIAEQLSTPCRADLKGKKIMVVIGEMHSNGVIYAKQQNYGQHFQVINTRLR